MCDLLRKNTKSKRNIKSAVRHCRNAVHMHSHMHPHTPCSPHTHTCSFYARKLIFCNFLCSMYSPETKKSSLNVLSHSKITFWGHVTSFAYYTYNQNIFFSFQNSFYHKIVCYWIPDKMSCGIDLLFAKSDYHRPNGSQ